MITDPTRPVVEGADTSSAVEAAAIARLHDYMRRAPGATDEQALIARDAFMAGFQYGGRWALRTSAQLADPRFREAIVVIAELMLGQEP